MWIAKSVVGFIAVIFIVSITGCAPEVGSDQWCLDMKEKPKGDWSVNEASEFTKSCILKR